MVEDGVGSIEGRAYTLFFTLVVHTKCKGVDEQTTINGEVLLGEGIDNLINACFSPSLGALSLPTTLPLPFPNNHLYLLSESHRW